MGRGVKRGADQIGRTPNDGRGDRIRTCDPLVPNQVRYQPAPLPDIAPAPSFAMMMRQAFSRQAFRALCLPPPLARLNRQDDGADRMRGGGRRTGGSDRGHLSRALSPPGGGDRRGRQPRRDDPAIAQPCRFPRWRRGPRTSAPDARAGRPIWRGYPHRARERSRRGRRRFPAGDRRRAAACPRRADRHRRGQPPPADRRGYA